MSLRIVVPIRPFIEAMQLQIGSLLARKHPQHWKWQTLSLIVSLPHYLEEADK